MLVERWDKRNWRVELFKDGSILITGLFKKKVNQQHSLPFWMSASNLPKYVLKMVDNIREAHPVYSRREE